MGFLGPSCDNHSLSNNKQTISTKFLFWICQLGYFGGGHSHHKPTPGCLYLHCSVVKKLFYKLKINSGGKP